MKKVLTLVVLVAIASIATTGVSGQTANSDPNSIMVHKISTKEQAIAQLDGSAPWDGRISRTALVNELTSNVNRYSEQLGMGWAPSSPDYFLASILPKLQVNTLGNVGDTIAPDIQIGGVSGKDKVSYNNRPDYIPGVTKFLTWDVRSYASPGEMYRFYIAKLECINPTIYVQKLEDKPLVQTKIDTIFDTDTFTVYKEKIVEVPVETGTTATATTPVINNYNYNYNTVPGGGYNGYSFWNTPSYGGCFGGGWNVGASWGFGSYQGCNSPWQGGFYGCSQPSQPSPYYNTGGGTTVNVYNDIYAGNNNGGNWHPWWPILFNPGGTDTTGTDGGPDTPDDDPDVPVITGTGDPNPADDDVDGKIGAPQMVGAEEFASLKKEEIALNNPSTSVSKPDLKGDGVKTNVVPVAPNLSPGQKPVTKDPVAVAPNLGASNGPSKDPGQNPVAISPNPGASQVKDPVVVPNPSFGSNPSKEDVALNNPSISVSKPEPSKGNGVKTDAVPVAVDPKPGVSFDGPSKGSVKEPVAFNTNPRPDNQVKDPVLNQNEAPIPVNHGANINIQDKGIYNPPPKPANNGQPKGEVKKTFQKPSTPGPKPGGPTKAKTTKKGG